MYKCGIRYVKDMLNNEGSFKDLNESKTLPRMEYVFNDNSILNSIKAFFSQQDISCPVPLAILNECHNPSINSYFFHIINKNDINK